MIFVCGVHGAEKSYFCSKMAESLNIESLVYKNSEEIQTAINL